MKSKVDLLFAFGDYVLDPIQNRSPFTKQGAPLSVTKNVPYSSLADICNVDIYRQPGTEKLPVVLYFHGGGLVAGTKDHRTGVARWMARQGVAVVNVDYGLAPDYTFLETAPMVADLVDWVAANADVYRFDTDKLVLAGDSGGVLWATITAAICTSEEYREGLGVRRPVLTPYACWFDCGLFDMDCRLDDPTNTNAVIQGHEFTGAAEENLRDFPKWKYVVPMNFLNEDFPEIVFLSYARNDIFCGGQTEKFMKKLDELGISYDSYAAKKAYNNHCYPLTWYTEEARENNDLVAGFLKRL